ncbi:hypothetical protein BJ508DRAFT_413715 [Ascobolus immersus RN42]|uniref:GAT domain-containing protein n=1 Tax=Ascobolus immersus RN42 TaxID=1160509 RepID=A0A3N4IAE7_ASCIM|nr:hypothetical protein BJ508DRAFT_413715 [Ascobolus immersus RN42]
MSSTKIPGMKKLFSLNAFKSNSKSGNATRNTPEPQQHNAVDSATADDTPEARIRSAMLGFCHAGGPTNTGDEVAFLPTIVEMAESSPSAAREAARVIRKQISLSNSNRPSVQYNGIMLLRILSDNPGAIFTRNLEASKFLASVKKLWEDGQDPSVRQIFWETMDYLQENKSGMEGLTSIIEWWKHEKLQATQPVIAQKKSSGGLSRFHSTKGNKQAKSRAVVHPIQSPIPPVDQLVSRISEAQASAKLLHQVISNTPKREVGRSELVKEFAIRCKNASKSIHSYITADADIEENLLTTLIETHELLSVALTRYNGLMEAYELQRAIEKSNGGKDRAVTPPPIDDIPLDADGFPIITPPSEGSRNSQAQHGGLGYSSFPNNNDRDMLDPYEYGKNPFADDNGEGSSRAYAYDDDDEPKPRIDKGKGRAVDSDDGRDLSPIDTTGVNGSSRARADTVDSVVSPVTPRDYSEPFSPALPTSTTGALQPTSQPPPPPPPAPRESSSRSSSLSYPSHPPPPPPVPQKRTELPYPLD